MFRLVAKSKLVLFKVFLSRRRSMKVSENRCSLPVGEWRRLDPSYNPLLNICRSNCEGLFYDLYVIFLRKAFSSCVYSLSLLRRNVLVKIKSSEIDIFISVWKGHEQLLSPKVCKILLYGSWIKIINFRCLSFCVHF